LVRLHQSYLSNVFGEALFRGFYFMVCNKFFGRPMGWEWGELEPGAAFTRSSVWYDSIMRCGGPSGHGEGVRHGGRRPVAGGGGGDAVWPRPRLLTDWQKGKLLGGQRGIHDPPAPTFGRKLKPLFENKAQGKKVAPLEAPFRKLDDAP